MIFVYPALMSENVDRRYFPGIIKTLELYYLHHIAEAAASGVINFYVIQNSRGGYSEVKLESVQGMGDYKPQNIIYEAGEMKLGDDSPEEKYLNEIEAEISKLEGILSTKEKELATKKHVLANILARNGGKVPEGDSGKTAGLYRRYAITTNEIEALEATIEKIKNQLSTLYKSRSQAKEKLFDKQREDRDSEKGSSTKKYETTGAASVKVDTSAMMDLRPTSISIEVTVRVVKSTMGFKRPSNQYEPKRSIPISVKLVPMVVKNFDDIYDVLIDDMYTNKFSAMYKSAARGFMGRAQNWMGGAIRKFVNAFIPSEEVSVWRDILMSRKGFADASSFRNSDRGPKYQKYAAAMVILSADDIRHQEQNFFDNPRKMMKMFKMGWNSFAVLNDADQTLTFCSYYENGLCAKIPYTYLFHSLKATDIFKEMEQLSGFTRRVIGNFGRTNLKKLSESINVRNEVDRRVTKYYNEYSKVAESTQHTVNEGFVLSTASSIMMRVLARAGGKNSVSKWNKKSPGEVIEMANSEKSAMPITRYISAKQYYKHISKTSKALAGDLEKTEEIKFKKMLEKEANAMYMEFHKKVSPPVKKAIMAKIRGGK
jgi:hypothetical protein